MNGIIQQIQLDVTIANTTFDELLRHLQTILQTSISDTVREFVRQFGCVFETSMNYKKLLQMFISAKSMR